MNLIEHTLEIAIAAPPARVWKALTGQVSSWWHPGFLREGALAFVIEPRVGGRVYEDWGGGQGLLWYTVVGLVETRSFTSPRNFIHNMPIYLGGSASSVDHGILHPDPKQNELWISNMNGWETIVMDLNTHKVNAYIPTPNGGDTHSGGFVRYTPDWNGELLADMGGPKAAVRATMRQRVAAQQPSAPAHAKTRRPPRP